MGPTQCRDTAQASGGWGISEQPRRTPPVQLQLFLNLALCPGPSSTEAETASKFAQNPLQGRVGFVSPYIGWGSP